MVISINSISFGIILDFQLKHIMRDQAIPANIASTWFAYICSSQVESGLLGTKFVVEDGFCLTRINI